MLSPTPAHVAADASNVVVVTLIVALLFHSSSSSSFHFNLKTFSCSFGLVAFAPGDIGRTCDFARSFFAYCCYFIQTLFKLLYRLSLYVYGNLTYNIFCCWFRCSSMEGIVVSFSINNSKKITSNTKYIFRSYSIFLTDDIIISH